MTQYFAAVGGTPAISAPPSRGGLRRDLARPDLVVGAACVLAAITVVLVQVLNLGRLLDASQLITAANAKPLIVAYGVLVAAIVGASAFLPMRLLWLPVVGAGLALVVSLAATTVLGGELRSFLWAVLTMAACWRVGRWLLELVGSPALARVPAVAWLAGAGSLGIVLLAIGRAGLISWWTAAVPFAVLGAVGVLGLARSWTPPRVMGAVRAVASTRMGAAAAAACLLLAALACVWAAAPELMYDSLSYKAWLPSEWARLGEIRLPAIHPVLDIAGFAQVLAVPGHVGGGDGVGRYMQYLAQAGLVASVWWAGRASRWAPLAAAAVAVTPLLFWEETTAYDDAILALCGLALALAVVSALREPVGSVAVTGAVLGALAGTCVSMKLHLAPLAAGLLLGWLLVRGRRGWPVALLAALAGAALFAGPLLVMKWIDLGNPLMPGFNGIFKSPYWPTTGDHVGYAGTSGASWRGAIEMVWTSVGDPARMTIWMPVGALGLLSLAVVIALLTGWRPGGRRAVRALWVGVVAGAVVWYLMLRDPRYLLPIGAVAVLLIVLSIETLPVGRASERLGLGALAATAVLLSPAAFALFWNLPGRDIPWRVALGREDVYHYEARATQDRDLLAQFDRLSPAGANAVADPEERAWLTEGRDLTPFWELDGRFRAAGIRPEGPAQTLRAAREAGISWAIAWNLGGQLVSFPYLKRMLDRFGIPVGVTDAGTIYRLPAPAAVDRHRRGTSHGPPVGH